MFMNLPQNLLFKNIYISNIPNNTFYCNNINIYPETLVLVFRCPVTILVKRIPVVIENINAILLSEKERRTICVNTGFSVGNSGLISPTCPLHRRREVETSSIDYVLEVARNKTGHKELRSHLQLIQCKNGKQWRHSI